MTALSTLNNQTDGNKTHTDGKNKHIVLVGCGRMGGALLKGWVNASSKVELTITVVEPMMDGCDMLESVRYITSSDELDDPIDLLIFAVKPQILKDVLPSYKALVNNACVISIVAGKTTDYYRQALGESIPVIRTMPNLPATISKGVTAAFATEAVSDDTKALTQMLFSTVGMFCWLEDEALLDPVTAISGSGPAYVFYFIESMVDAAVGLGLPESMALDMVLETIRGSVALARDSEEMDISQPRVNVTSPGGTTEAALNVLMDSVHGLKPLVERAVSKANARAEELAD